MGLLDRILGRKAELQDAPPPAGVPPRDAAAVERYERMLRTAPPEVIEAAHVEAFERLSPAQLDLLFERFTASATADDERPADARPASLARSAATTERRRPGSIARTLEETDARAQTNLIVGASILDAVVWYSVASLAWSDWNLPDDAPGAHPSDGLDTGDGWDIGL
jgi:hypothetical protein